MLRILASPNSDFWIIHDTTPNYFYVSGSGRLLNDLVSLSAFKPVYFSNNQERTRFTARYSTILAELQSTKDIYNYLELLL